MNILQKVYFKQNDICNLDDMYIRTSGKVLLEEDGGRTIYCLQKQAKIATNTYFNYFTSSKWLKYTKITNFFLELDAKGKFILKIIYSFLEDNDVKCDVVKVCNINNSKREKVVIKHDFKLDPFEGMYYFELEALENNSVFYDAMYLTDIDSLNEVHIGIVMCTYKREKFIKRNLGIIEGLSNDILSRLDMYIVDNAHTLSQELIINNNIHLIQNKNTGGAGGFTRGIIEVLEKRPDITHVLLMDDDILLNTIALERTICYLTFLKKEHSDLFIGGATLSLSKKNVQLEAGATWNSGVLYNLKAGFDLEKDKSLLLNNMEESFSYNSWVYLCIPVIKISLDNLPLPVFVRGDDMEYGMRLIDNLLLTNGIGVWHVPVHNKYSGFMTYYVLRNILLLNALYDKTFGKKEAIKLLVKSVIRETMYFRYDNVTLLFKAYEDFLGGINFFLNTDGEKLHKEIMEACNKLLSYKDLEKNGYPFIYGKYTQGLLHAKENKIKKVIRLGTLNGYLIPSFIFNKGKFNIVEFTAARPIDFYGYKYVLQVDLTTQKGCVTKKSINMLLKITCQLLKMCSCILLKYNNATSDYKSNIHKLQNVQFWKQYLGR